MTPEEARRLLKLWDEQQSAYVAHREARFDAMLSVLRLAAGDAPVVLDLACGPGAISRRVLAAFPQATVIAVDYDPILLSIARGALDPARTTVHDLDLVGDDWAAKVGQVDAVLSSTALHWLSPAQLLDVYTRAAGLIRPGGVLLNADHLRFDDAAPARRDLAERHDEQTQRAGFAAGALNYGEWYAEALRVPELAPLAEEREKRFADRPPQPLAPLDFHVAALRSAGFAEAGPVWQFLDDYVVLGWR